MVVAVDDPRRIVSTALRHASIGVCEERSRGKLPCHEAAWGVLGDDADGLELCLDHAAEWLSIHMRMLETVWKELHR